MSKTLFTESNFLKAKEVNESIRQTITGLLLEKSEKIEISRDDLEKILRLGKVLDISIDYITTLNPIFSKSQDN